MWLTVGFCGVWQGHSGSGGNELQTNNYNECFASIREHAHESGLRWYARNAKTVFGQNDEKSLLSCPTCIPSRDV